MRIRPAQPDEAGALGAIARAAKASWGYSVAELDAWRDALLPSVESLRVQPTYLAELNGEVTGFYQLTVKAESIELEHLWGHPKFIRQRVGRALLAHATEYSARSGVAK